MNNNQQRIELLREILNRYSEYEAKAKARLGEQYDAKDFDNWFSQQLGFNLDTIRSN